MGGKVLSWIREWLTELYVVGTVNLCLKMLSTMQKHQEEICKENKYKRSKKIKLQHQNLPIWIKPGHKVGGVLDIAITPPGIKDNIV